MSQLNEKNERVHGKKEKACSKKKTKNKRIINKKFISTVKYNYGY